MKKLVSLIMISCLIFSMLTCINVSALEIVFPVTLKKDYPCYKVFDIVTFNEKNLQADLSNAANICTYEEDSSLRFHLDGRNEIYKMVYKVEKGEFFGYGMDAETLYGGKFGVIIDFKPNNISSALRAIDINFKFNYIEDCQYTVSACLFTHVRNKVYFDMDDITYANFVEIEVENRDDWDSADVVISPIECFYGETAHNIVMKGYREPTCIYPGSTGRKHCTVCGEDFSMGYLTPPKGHKEVVDKAVKATCDKSGLTEGKHCEVCGRITKAQEVVKPTGHKYKWVTDKKATYFAKGKKAYKCEVCQEVSKTKTIDKLKLKTPKVKITGVKSKLTVKYTKVSKATGFKVKYIKGKKTVTRAYKTKKSITKPITGLKKGTYKVRVCAMIQSGSKKAYSNWTNFKTVKVK